jgi:hypothetical protein
VTDKTSDDPGAPGPQRQSKLSCSFCGKSQDEVRKLIAGPQVYICDECVETCNDVLEKDFEPPAAVADQAPGQPATFNLSVACALCHLPTPTGEVLPIAERGFLCMVCLEAVRAAAEESEGK